MTNKAKKAWLEAIDQLKKYYKGEIELAKCPLCEVIQNLFITPSCYNCLWTKFEGMFCSEYSTKHYKADVKYLRVTRNKKWVKDSLSG